MEPWSIRNSFKYKLCALVVCCLISANSHALSFITVGDSIAVGLVRWTDYAFCPPTGQVFTDTGLAVCRGRGAVNLGGFQPFLANLLGAVVYNYGWSGRTSAEILQESRIALRKPAEYEVIMAGTVDIIVGVPLPEILNNINTIADEAIDKGVTPLVLTLAPLSGSHLERFNSTLIHFNDLLKSEARATVIETYPILASDWNAYHSGDHIHLNATGNLLVAQEIAAHYRDRYPKIIAISPIINFLLQN